MLRRLLIIKALNADFPGTLQPGGFHQGSDGDDFDFRKPFFHCGGSLQPIGAVVHQNIHQNQIHRRMLYKFQYLRSRGKRRRYFIVFLGFQVHFKQLSYHQLIIHY